VLTATTLATATATPIARLHADSLLVRACITPPSERHDMTEPFDCADKAEPLDWNENADVAAWKEPIENADIAEPTEPIDANDPMEPIDSTDPFDAIERIESSDHRDQFVTNSVSQSHAVEAPEGIRVHERPGQVR